LSASCPPNGTRLSSELEASLNLMFARWAHAFLAKFEKRIQEDFPELEKDPAALQVVHHALERAITRVMSEHFLDPLERAERLGESFAAIENAPAIKALSKGELEEKLLGSIQKMLNENVSGYLGLPFRLTDAIEQAAIFGANAVDFFERQILFGGGETPAAPGN
jgi:hypothetical protein